MFSKLNEIITTIQKAEKPIRYIISVFNWLLDSVLQIPKPPTNNAIDESDTTE